ncbi:hypothetical protein I316_00408 [Kwoniella heveanensis BCC8398]|uniref:Uncharacterized protein n=1 Tax=Kwoniella heveanensis BCC8398 TaxID=1296120 RepID=A0A1B9H4I8_9TREE|nr:hypothetical protein I316_00408 [Kwoniella heveanensis BCC8398]
MSQDYTPHLLQAQALLQDLIAHINAFDIERLLYHAPITDRIKFKESPWGQEEVMGMRKWIEGIHHHARILESLTLSGIPPKEDPLPTVQGLITYWKIIVTSKPPIVGVRMTMGGEKRIQAGNKLTNGQRSGASTPLGARKGGSNGASSVKGKEKEVWVDVVADGGKEWIRIYSKKISHLLAEFREADSYINSDYDSETDEENLSEEAGQSGPTRKVNSGTNGEASDTPSNSLLEMARDLSRAASMVDRIPGAEQPKLNIRLTRIPERAQDLYNENDDRHFPSSGSHEGSEWPDSRIPDTFDRVRSMGVNLLFGDLSDISLSSPLLKGYPVPAEAVPSLKINLDITTLMGLCSDVLHYPLPANRQEAARRSLRPADQLLVSASGQVGSRGRDGTGRGKGKGKKEDKKELEEEDEELRGQSQNSRELFRCILEEMERPFIEEFDKVLRTAWNDQKRRTKDEDHQREARALNDIIKDNATDVQDRLSELATDESNMPRVEFWTTRQAAQYTYEALSSGPAHGYGAEQRRMRRMLGLEKGDFFEGSRYEGKAGIFGGFKLRIFDTNRFEPGALVIEETRAPSLGLPGGEESDSNGVTAAKTGFHRTLASITQLFLDQYYASIPPSLSEQTSSSSSAPTATTIILPNFLQPKKIPTPPIAKITLPFPVVSLHSLQRGAEEGMTTVMMGTATLKEVWGQTRWRVRGWERGWYDLDWKEVDGHNSKDEQEEWKTESRPQRRERGPTAVMIFPYRVFGEGKRVRFEKGDYSYPAPQ